MKGEKFLKITGILMIIGGALGIIFGLLAVVGVAALASAVEGSAGVLYLAAFLVLVSAIIELIAGIMGVKYCKVPEKAQSCLVIGIVVAVMSVLGQILNVVGGSSFSATSLITGLILPVLYIVGAVLNKKSA